MMVPVIGDVTIMLGSVFVLMSLILLPTPFMFIVLLSSAVSLYLANVPSLFIATHILEIIVIAYLLKRQFFILTASVMFWALMGTPLLWLLIKFNPSFLQEIPLVIAIQYGLNGIFNAAIAASILAIIPLSYKQSRLASKERTLSKNIFSLCASLMVVPVLIISFVFIALTSREYETLLVQKIKSNSVYVAELTQNFIDQHKTIIEHHAMLLSNDTPLEKVHASMRVSQLNYPAFFSLTTADANGQLLFFAPEKLNTEIAGLPDELKSVADRAYFGMARDNKRTTLSNTLLSRGVVVAPMISVASPIFKNNVFDGIVFGAINLHAMNAFKSRIEPISTDAAVVITDSDNLTVYASDEEIARPLSTFLPLPSYHYIISKLPVLNNDDKRYAYFRSTTDYGWNIYILTESSSFTKHLRDNFVIASVCLLIVMGIFLLFAYKLAHQITQPLVAMLNADEETVSLDNRYPNSKEFSDVANKLKRTQFLMRNFENRLKQQVNEKTEQLEQLNLQLAAQAREDGMTQLLNRSGFDELALNAIKTSYRLGQPFSLALLDIDHFKNINDNFGHLMGDKCLQAFSALMQRNCKRDTDIIGRYGGEEFVILMSGKNIHAHHQLMQNIHQQTRNISLKQADTGELIKFTVSIGICSVLGNANLELQEIVKLADEELYKCKRAGRDRISAMTVGYSDNI
jgi:diguanylate cyclase (GGDEF)-like protein